LPLSWLSFSSVAASACAGAGAANTQRGIKKRNLFMQTTIETGRRKFKLEVRESALRLLA
jgi:hypothetical protein